MITLLRSFVSKSFLASPGILKARLTGLAGAGGVEKPTGRRGREETFGEGGWGLEVGLKPLLLNQVFGGVFCGCFWGGSRDSQGISELLVGHLVSCAWSRLLWGGSFS